MKTELSLYKKRENTAVSGEHPVAVVPSVRVRNRVGVHVPAAVVGIPVDVHRAEFSYRKPSMPLSFDYS